MKGPACMVTANLFCMLFYSYSCLFIRYFVVLFFFQYAKNTPWNAWSECHLFFSCYFKYAIRVTEVGRGGTFLRSRYQAAITAKKKHVSPLIYSILSICLNYSWNYMNKLTKRCCLCTNRSRSITPEILCEFLVKYTRNKITSEEFQFDLAFENWLLLHWRYACKNPSPSLPLYRSLCFVVIAIMPMGEERCFGCRSYGIIVNCIYNTNTARFVESK